LHEFFLDLLGIYSERFDISESVEDQECIREFVHRVSSNCSMKSIDSIAQYVREIQLENSARKDYEKPSCILDLISFFQKSLKA
jgi:hypothetical protein